MTCFSCVGKAWIHSCMQMKGNQRNKLTSAIFFDFLDVVKCSFQEFFT